MRPTPVILVADDDKDFREVVVAKLNAKGFITKTASDGDDAVKTARSVMPDLILMDVDMPSKDGITATSELQQDPHTKGIKIIFLTNLGDASWPQSAEINRRLAQQAGAVDYVKKGIDLEALVARIHEKLGQ